MRRRLIIWSLLGMVWAQAFVTAGSAPSAPAPELPPALSTRLESIPPADQIAVLLEESAKAEDHDVELARALIALATARISTPAERLAVLQREQAFVMQRGDYDRGLQLAETILDLTRDLNLPVETFRAHIARARAQRLVGDSPGALRELQRALELSQDLSDVYPDIARAYSMMASVYRRQSELDSAAACYDQALAITREHHLDQLQITIQANQSLVLMELGRFAEAKQTLLDVLAHHEATGNRMSAASARFNLAAIAHHTGDLPGAIQGFESVLQDYLDLDSKGREANTRLALAEIHLERNDLPAALSQLEAAQPAIEASGNLTHRVKFQRLEVVALAAQGEMAASIAASQRYMDLNDELAGSEVKRDIARLRAENELARKNTELAEVARDRALAAAALDHAAAELTRTRTRYLAFAITVMALGLAGLGVVLARRRADHRILAETERARRAAEATTELKTRLLAIASHDLKSPLTLITLCADQLATFPPDTDFTRKASRQILEQSRRMTRLIGDLLDHSAIEFGQLELRRKPCCLAGLIREIVAQHQPSADHKSIRLEATIAPDCTTTEIPLDPARIEQALTNLLSNALKYSPPHTTVQVTVQATPTALVTLVQDQGPGFTATDLAHAFRPFQTLSAKATGGESSSGLGLSIAHEIVELHGGTLTIVSPSNQGATVRMELPRD